MSIFSKILGDPNERIVKSLGPLVAGINAREAEMEKLPEPEFKSRTAALKEAVAGAGEAGGREALDRILPEAFALAREAARRVLGQRHYDVQLVGGIVLHRGQIAEMRTGEGKTLVATLPLFLNALAGRGAHLVTVNDYLSRVGAGWMAPVYHYLGLKTSVIVHEAAYTYDPDYTDAEQYDQRLKHFRPVPRREAYLSDILYGTNNEFGFDYLRDNMVSSPGQMVQRELYYAIVDEVDSILIDEARTPLIISAPAEESTDKYYKFAALVKRLKENEDYNVDEKMRAATLTENGIGKMEKWLGVDNIYTSGGIREVHHIEQALKAHALFKRDRDYVVKDGEVIIVDEFTGRLMQGRRYSEGLHQAIEAKEGAKIQRESQTLATVTFQNYFRLYEKLAGMTGTAATEAEEFAKIYRLETVVIPTHKPMVRRDLNDLIYRSEAGKYRAVIAEVKKRHEAGQPVLVGTISIDKNEMLADMMARAGLRPAILNAKHHEEEARIIAEAGKPGAITIATNMAGRGVDIMLGGAEPANDGVERGQWREEHEKVVALGGLHVIGTERHEARRIDNQLRGRAGRQGDPGSSQFYVSTEDDLMRVFGGDRMKSLMQTLKVPEDMPVENKLISKSIESAQKRVEGYNFDVRKHLVEYDDVINKHREAVYRRRREILRAAEEAKGSGPDGRPDLRAIIEEYLEREIESLVSVHAAGDDTSGWNLGEIGEAVNAIFPAAGIEGELGGFAAGSHKLDRAARRTEMIELILSLARKRYDEMSERAQAAGYNWGEIEKAVLIRSIDTLWVEHLEAMSSMRQGIGLRGYGQRDPLVEYKKEAYRLYHQLVDLIQKEVVNTIFKVGALHAAPAAVFAAPGLLERARQFSAPAKTMAAGVSPMARLERAAVDGTGAARAGTASAAFDRVKPKARDASGLKIGRNDPCPCGSGKKYKKCHGR